MLKEGINIMQDIVYFELNNWENGNTYPDCEPYLTWMDDRILQLSDKEWIEKNKLAVVETYVDMSCNYCVTAKREWVEKNCNEILTTNTQFLRFPNENGMIYGQFGCPFMEYSEENIGYWYAGWDKFDNWKPKRVDD